MNDKVVVLPEASKDRSEIICALRQFSPEVGRKCYTLFAQELRSLAQFPNRCPPAHDPELAARGYRFLVVRNYLVFYTVQRDTVTIRRIVDRCKPLPSVSDFT